MSSLPRSTLLALLLACNSPPSGATDGSTTAATTGASTSTDDPSPPTEPDPSTGVAATAGATTDAACDDGAARCPDDGEREVCEDGAWRADPCPDDEGCSADDPACRPCSCDPVADTACLDSDTLDACHCFAKATEECKPNSACDTIDGVTACHKVVCAPGDTDCATADVAQTCNATGTAWSPTACPTTELCDTATGACMDACMVVAKLDSSLGCDFWAVDMPNIPPRNNYLYAVALANPSTKAAAHVRVYDRNGGAEQKVAEGTIDPRDVRTFNLAGKQGSSEGFYDVDAGFLTTGIAKGRAFHIVSDVPIVATQFNPVGGAEAYSTDASLLLPTHTLGKTYWHMAWATGSGAGSTLDVVATKDNTIVTITSPVDVPAGTNGMPALTAGIPKPLPPLSRNDYIQISLAAGKDLTATRISANAEIAVFGGHSCAHVPVSGIDGCDHLEEQIFPISTWGTHFVAGRAAPRGDERMTWRVLASEDDTTVTFDPPVSLGASAQLGTGEFVEFSADGDFDIASDGHPVLVAGYLHGCEDAGLGSDCPGDPSMVLVVPTQQWVADYVFGVDTSYTNNTAKLIRPTGVPVTVGCLGEVPDAAWTAVTPDYESAVVTFNGGDCNPGTNTATSDEPFAIMVVGEADITSYAYPGGLQLKPINPG